jgi:hypothetical protein
LPLSAYRLACLALLVAVSMVLLAAELL